MTPNAVTILERRYLIKDDKGQPIEKPEDLFWRVARTIAAPDKTYGASDRAVEGLAETFFELMATRVWMPNSPTLMNAGDRWASFPRASCCGDDCLSNARAGTTTPPRGLLWCHQWVAGRASRSRACVPRTTWCGLRWELPPVRCRS